MIAKFGIFVGQFGPLIVLGFRIKSQNLLDSLVLVASTVILLSLSLKIEVIWVDKIAYLIHRFQSCLNLEVVGLFLIWSLDFCF